MKLSILAKRQQEAHEQLETAVLALAATLNLEAPEMTPRTKQPKVARLVRDENLGAFLAQAAEAVADIQPPVSGWAARLLDRETILSIPGLTKTSREAINAFFEEQDAGPD